MSLETLIEGGKKMSKKQETVNENVDVQTNKAEIIGVVHNCSKLNIRKEPNVDSEVLCVVDSGSNLQIDLVNSTYGWFSVCTETGIEGFCMKEYAKFES